MLKKDILSSEADKSWVLNEINKLRIKIFHLIEDKNRVCDFDDLKEYDFEISLLQWNLRYFEKQYDRLCEN